jgi:hypothetical protein
MDPAYDIDDEDDLDARADLGYAGSREAEPDDLDERHDAPPPAPVSARTGLVTTSAAPYTAGIRGDCRDCKAKDVALMPRGGSESQDRVVCAKCQGAANRDQVERTREVIRSLKAAAATGDSEEERKLEAQLAYLVGVHQARETAAAIRAKLNDQPARGRR